MKNRQQETRKEEILRDKNAVICSINSFIHKNKDYLWKRVNYVLLKKILAYWEAQKPQLMSENWLEDYVFNTLKDGIFNSQQYKSDGEQIQKLKCSNDKNLRLKDKIHRLKQKSHLYDNIAKNMYTNLNSFTIIQENEYFKPTVSYLQQQIIKRDSLIEKLQAQFCHELKQKKKVASMQQKQIVILKKVIQNLTLKQDEYQRKSQESAKEYFFSYFEKELSNMKKKYQINQEQINKTLELSLKHIKILTSEKTTLEEQNQRFLQELKKKQQQIEHIASGIGRLEKQAKVHQQNYKREREENKKRQNENNTLHQINHHLENKINQLEKSINDLEIIKIKLQLNLGDFSQELQQKKAQNISLKSILEERQKTIKKLEAYAYEYSPQKIKQNKKGNLTLNLAVQFYLQGSQMEVKRKQVFQEKQELKSINCELWKICTSNLSQISLARWQIQTLHILIDKQKERLKEQTEAKQKIKMQYRLCLHEYSEVNKKLTLLDNINTSLESQIECLRSCSKCREYEKEIQQIKKINSELEETIQYANSLFGSKPKENTPQKSFELPTFINSESELSSLPNRQNVDRGTIARYLLEFLDKQNKIEKRESILELLCETLSIEGDDYQRVQQYLQRKKIESKLEKEMGANFSHKLYKFFTE